MNKEIVYSFIIPHKNCPLLLQRCIDSIPVRDDLQILVVDDNSDEGERPLVVRRDVEVILLDSSISNGAGKARNVGLQHAKGKWLLFADADDYYSDYLPVLLDNYSSDERTDIVYLNACKFDENGIRTPYKTEKLINDYLNKVNNSEKKLRYDLWTPWSRMIKRRIVETYSISFDEIPAGNDVMFGLKCSQYSQNIAVEKNIIYNYYRPCKGSVTDAARIKMSDDLYYLRGQVIELYNEVEFNSHTNLFSLFLGDVKHGRASIISALRRYFYYLNMFNIGIVRDLFIFIHARIIGDKE